MDEDVGCGDVEREKSEMYACGEGGMEEDSAREKRGGFRGPARREGWPMKGKREP